jgi:dipeptidase E
MIVDPAAHLLAQDAVYVGGGSMRNMLAVWREHGVDGAMRQAWERGVVLAGLSAGAMCWFEGGVTMSGGAPRPAPGMRLLDGSMSVHLDSEPERLPAYRHAVATGALPDGYAVDDCAALLFAGTRLRACVASRADARVIEIRADGQGATTEQAQAVKLLPGAESPLPGEAGGETGAEPYGVSELRALRAGRNRWD